MPLQGVQNFSIRSAPLLAARLRSLLGRPIIRPLPKGRSLSAPPLAHFAASTGRSPFQQQTGKREAPRVSKRQGSLMALTRKLRALDASGGDVNMFKEAQNRWLPAVCGGGPVSEGALRFLEGLKGQ